MLSVFMCKRGFGRQMVYFRVLLLDQAVTTAHIFEYFIPAVAIHGGKPGKFPKIPPKISSRIFQKMRPVLPAVWFRI
jgi:hypothetical protein